MMRTLSPRGFGIAGAAAGALALLFAVMDAKAATAGWLAAFVFCGAVPLGGLALRMMTRLIPGAWSAELAPTAELASMILPLAGLAVLPVLLGAHALYPWAAGSGVYLSVWFFSLRSILFLAAAIALAFLLATRPAWSMVLSAGGLIAFVLLDDAVVVDWLMSLEPTFHSSGFGLYVLSIQMSIALMAVVVIRLIADPEHAQAKLLGALMLTALLLWDYLSFMQYFIIWSENLPKEVAWFQERGRGIWSAAEIAFVSLDLAGTLLLFFTPIRGSRRWLLAIAAAAMLAKAIEIGWLVFPAVPASLTVSFSAAILAILGLALLAVAFLAWTAHAPRALRKATP